MLFLKDSLEGEGVGDLTSFAFVCCCSCCSSTLVSSDDGEEKQLHLLKNDLIFSILAVQ